MVENEKIIKEDIKLPENILSEKEEIKIEEPDNEIKVEQQQEIKPEKNILEKASDVIFPPVAAAEKKIFTDEQQKDFNKLLELDVKPEDAKKIILGEQVETKKIETEGKRIKKDIKEQEKASRRGRMFNSFLSAIMPEIEAHGGLKEFGKKLGKGDIKIFSKEQDKSIADFFKKLG